MRTEEDTNNATPMDHDGGPGHQAADALAELRLQIQSLQQQMQQKDEQIQQKDELMQQRDKRWKEYLDSAQKGDTPPSHEHIQQVEALLAQEPPTTAVPKNDGRPCPY